MWPTLPSKQQDHSCRISLSNSQIMSRSSFICSSSSELQTYSDIRQWLLPALNSTKNPRWRSEGNDQSTSFNVWKHQKQITLRRAKRRIRKFSTGDALNILYRSSPFQTPFLSPSRSNSPHTKPCELFTRLRGENVVVSAADDQLRPDQSSCQRLVRLEV